jgi:uncharacterized membrane protein YgaE (UPF0421/DUF939 family)
MLAVMAFFAAVMALLTIAESLGDSASRLGRICSKVLSAAYALAPLMYYKTNMSKNV